MSASRLRAIALVAGLSAVLVLNTSCSGDEEPNSSAPSSQASSPGTGSPSDETPTDRNTPEPTATTQCADLIAAGWQAPNEEPAVSYDPETGIGQVNYENEELVLDFVHDRDCLKLAQLKILVRSALNGP